MITALDAEPVESPQGLIEALGERQPGDKIALSILRPGEEEERQIEVTLGENLDEEGKAYRGVIVGFFRVDRFEERQAPDALQPLDRFFERFQIPFEFEFKMPPELFEEEPCCSGGSAA